VEPHHRPLDGRSVRAARSRQPTPLRHHALGRVGAGHRELHLVPIPIDLGRGEDGAHLERGGAAQAFQTIRDLLGLKGELRVVGEMLEAAAAAAPEIWARRLDAARRGLLDGLDGASAKAGSRLDEPDA
jgi:hypothetical protein